MNIAIVQAPLIWEDVVGNLMAFDGRVLRVDKADVIVLPEMFASGFTMTGKEAVARRYADVCQRMRVWAANKQALVMGSTVFRAGKHYYNRLLAVFPSGEILTYDKRHCFTMGGEASHFVAGRQRLVFDYKGARFAPFVCYDLRFPVWCRNTVGYDIAVYVANWPQARRNVWQTLLKARAIENQCYVVGVNRVGDDPACSYSGDSVVLDAYGHTLAACTPGKECVAYAYIDMNELAKFRHKFPVLADGDDFALK